jgi:hypothetical protein
MKFTEADQTQVRKIRFSVVVSDRKLPQARQVIAEDERRADETGVDEFQHERGTLQVESCFG